MKSSIGLPTVPRECDCADEHAPLIFAVQHFCVHDGPGTRSVVFFKGCPLRCAWCHNPESWRVLMELGHKAHLCIDCRTCVDACPTGAIASPGRWDPAACDLCLECVAACPSGAMVRFGEARSVASLMDELRLEYPIYRRSGGGVTLSGGEPTLFPGFAARLAQALAEENIHVAVETCGLFHLGPPESAMDRLLRHTDLLLFDIKLHDPDAHRAACGVGNERVKDNLALLSERRGPAVWPRMPVIPSVTDTAENIAGWGQLLRRLGFQRMTVVPYNSLGVGKRAWLRDLPPAPDIGPQAPSAMARVRARFAEEGISAYLPGEEPWHALGVGAAMTA